MMPKVYVDIEVRTQGETTDMNPPMLRGQLLSKLHHLFSAKPHTYAVAIPDSPEGLGKGVLRIFASCLEDLDILVDKLRQIPWMRDYTRIHYPMSVPADFAGDWVAFSRYRIPTLKADRKTGQEHGALRQRRMKTARQERLDYFILHSKTTGQCFSLAIQKQKGHAPQRDCLPNSYGLCSKESLFCVPDLP